MTTHLKKLFLITILIISSFILSLPFFASSTYAKREGQPAGGGADPETSTTDVCSSNADEAVKEAAGCNGSDNLVANIITNILYVIIFVVGIISAIYIVVGGIKYMSSKGDASATQTAKKTILYSLIGLIISSLAFIIVNFSIGVIYSDGTVPDSSNDNGDNPSPNRGQQGGTILNIYMISQKKVEIGESQKLRANIMPVWLSNSPLTWKSSDSGIVSVDSEGKLTPKKEGTATVTVTSENGKTASTEIIVTKPIVPERVVLSPSTLNISKGITRAITPTVFPSNATNKSLKWSSKDKSIATVNSRGQVKGKKAGTTTITAKTNNGKSATVTVKVTDASSGDGPIQVNKNLTSGLSKYYQDDYGGSQYAVSCYSSGGAGQKGCGISAYLAAYYALTNKHVGYKSFAQEVCNKGLSIPVAVDQLGSKFKSKYKIQLNSIGTSWDAAVKALKKGYPVIILTGDPKYARANLHYITAISYDENKGVYIWNPNKKSIGWHDKSSFPSVKQAWSVKKTK